MTAADLLTELALIAALTFGWVALVMLMMEKDRKREERYRKAGRHTADSSEGAANPPPTASRSEEKLT